MPNDEIERNQKVLAQYHAAKEAKEARRIFQLLPQGPGSGLDADLLDGMHAEEIIEEAASRPVRVAGGGGGKGMEQHGNEYHDPNFAEEIHTHTESEITDLDHDAQKIKGKTVDDAAIGDGKVLTYKTASGKIEYTAPAGGGDMTKAVYDTDDDGIVDDSEKLEGSTKNEVQTHAPAEHGNESHNPDFATETALATHEADPDIHHPQAHSLASHSTKAHAELTGVGASDHHAKTTSVAELSDHDKAAHDALGIDAATLETENLAGVRDHSPKAHTHIEADITDLDHLTEPEISLANLGEKAHGSLTGVTSDQHHAEAHTLTSHSSKAHSELTNVTADQHHAQLHKSSHISGGSDALFIYSTLSFAVVGNLETGTDKAPTILIPCTLTIVKAKLVVKTAPTGAAIIVDVNKNGTTIFTTQANRPQIAAGATIGDSGTPDITALSEDDKITIDIDQIGSGDAGADLTVEVVCKQFLSV